MPSIEGFTFSPPSTFRVEEVTMGMSGGLPGKGGVSPSLIVQTKPARAGATLDELAAEVLGELLQTMPSMKDGTKGEITFDDGEKGVVLSYALVSSKGEFRQYFVMRLSPRRLCTATLTVPTAELTPAVASSMMNLLTSIAPT